MSWICVAASNGALTRVELAELDDDDDVEVDDDDEGIDDEVIMSL